MKANLTGVPETLFITLRIRAIETVRQDAAIKDPYSADILKQIEFEASDKDKVSEASQTGTIFPKNKKQIHSVESYFRL